MPIARVFAFQLLILGTGWPPKLQQNSSLRSIRLRAGLELGSDSGSARKSFISVVLAYMSKAFRAEVPSSAFVFRAQSLILFL